MDTEVKVAPCLFFAGRWIDARTIIGLRQELKQSKKDSDGKVCYAICIQVSNWNKWVTEWWVNRKECDERWEKLSKIMPIIKVFQKENKE